MKRIKNTKAELWDQQKLTDAKEKDNMKLEAVINQLNTIRASPPKKTEYGKARKVTTDSELEHEWNYLVAFDDLLRQKKLNESLNSDDVIDLHEYGLINLDRKLRADIDEK